MSRTGAWIGLAIGLSIGISNGGAAIAQPPTARTSPASTGTTPDSLFQTLAGAASQKQLASVLSCYSESFRSQDGLDRQGVGNTLESLWQLYPQVQFTSQVLSSQVKDGRTIAEVETRISGTGQRDGRSLRLEGRQVSRYTLEQNQIVAETVLNEESRQTTGAKPPQLTVQLPERVLTGQQFSFDAIVEDPLGDDFLLGSISSTPVTKAGYLQPQVNLRLEALQAGGLFKQARAPQKPGQFWMTALVVRKDGMITVARRLTIADQ